MIKVSTSGDFSKTYAFLNNMSFLRRLHLDAICQQGVHELKKATPKDSGKTANSWSYDISYIPILGLYRITFSNSNIQNGVSIAVILDTGHATRNGSWIEGEHYIDPAIRPTFNKIVELAWKEVTKIR